MEEQRIRALLDKYYQGLTDRKEEEELQLLLQEEDLPEDLQTDGELFAAMLSDADIPPHSADLNEKILKRLEPEFATRTRRIHAGMFLRIAASFLILLAAYVAFIRPQTQLLTSELTDTYDDPELAMAEAKRVLVEMSLAMNKGAQKLSPLKTLGETEEKVQKLGKATESLQPLKKLDHLNKGLEGAEMVRQLITGTEKE